VRTLFLSNMPFSSAVGFFSLLKKGQYLKEKNTFFRFLNIERNLLTENLPV